MRHRLRRLFPPAATDQYERFDLATALLLIAGPVYLIDHPAMGTRKTLSWLLGPTPQTLWGALLVAAALVAVICSYRASWVRRGYGTVATACAFWSAALFLGLLTEAKFGSGWQWTGLASAVLYGYFARQAFHQAGQLANR